MPRLTKPQHNSPYLACLNAPNTNSPLHYDPTNAYPHLPILTWTVLNATVLTNPLLSLTAKTCPCRSITLQPDHTWHSVPVHNETDLARPKPSVPLHNWLTIPEPTKQKPTRTIHAPPHLPCRGQPEPAHTGPNSP